MVCAPVPKRRAGAKVSRETATLADLGLQLDRMTPDQPFDWRGFIRRLAVVSPTDHSALKRKAELVLRVCEVIQPAPDTDAGCLSWLAESLATDIIGGGVVR
jgi:hypothetical protein